MTKRQPHVMGAKVILALLREECPPYGSGVARHLGIRQCTANKLLLELFHAGLLARKQVRKQSVPPVWVYEVKDA